MKNQRDREQKEELERIGDGSHGSWLKLEVEGLMISQRI